MTQSVLTPTSGVDITESDLTLLAMHVGRRFGLVRATGQVAGDGGTGVLVRGLHTSSGARATETTLRFTAQEVRILLDRANWINVMSE